MVFSTQPPLLVLVSQFNPHACYCPAFLCVCRYWDTRPTAVITRITQLMLIAGSFISGLVSDVATGAQQQ